MAPTASSNEVVQRYVSESVAEEQNLENLLAEFGKDGDDDEVRQIFSRLADQSRVSGEKLAGKSSTANTEPVTKRGGIASGLWRLLERASSDVMEERTARNLVMSYTLQANRCAHYEALASVAHAAGDEKIEALAREIQMQAQSSGEAIWKLISSRAKIAFNMLTVSEVDPAVETKIADNRLLEE